MAQAFKAVLFDLYGTLVDESGEAAAGARQLLSGLKPEHWAVVTSCGRQFAFELLARAGLPKPLVLIGADDVVRMKPSPAGYLEAAKRLGAPAAACLVVEDSSSGILAGKNAGMTVVAIARGRDTLFAGADRTVEALSELAFDEKEEGTIALR